MDIKNITLSTIIDIVNRRWHYLIYVLYYQYFCVPFIVKRVRQKDKIKVLFLLTDVAAWKTEQLYNAMSNHSRFIPMIGITENRELKGAEKDVRNYCDAQNYYYINISPNKRIVDQLDVDIIMYQKPYKKQIHPLHWIDENRRALCIMSTYFLHDVLERWQTTDYIYNTCWQQYFENESVSIEFAKLQRNKGRNNYVTGTPFMDALLQPKIVFKNPWGEAGKKKRIIYAPHHSLPGLGISGVEYSTFMDYADAMLQLLNKYREQVYFIFKPHPRLYHNLLHVWGKEKTDAYYMRWKNAVNGELLEGQYLPCFKHSDALIHDCGSFTIEYHYTGNPVLYLENSAEHTSNMCSYAKKAYDLHYKAHSVSDIEQFILNVIKGKDPLKTERDAYTRQYLTPPHGKSACENIINAILGEAEYSNR